ncbi:transposase [Ammonicoccus fulvus]|uniref:Transposase n=1 Tax=Ammonicoccus fulvus TaxID=3138240 RepID=A0ABZ3FVV4_9ACTN
MARELIDDIRRIDQRKHALDLEITDLVDTTGTRLMELCGIGPLGAASLLIEVGDITRFPTKAHFASWNGTAPIDASSGAHTRHRLSRAGNRRINSVLHTMGQTQRRLKIPEALKCYNQHHHGPHDELKAMRALKRRLSDIIYRTMINDALDTTRTGPGGHQDHDSHSSAAGSQPHTDSSDKPLHGPATNQPKPPLKHAS